MKRWIFILIQLTILLSSCGKEASRKAYCFSMVFERDEEQCVITAYCKTSKNDTSGEMANISLRFNGNNFKKALSDTDKGDYDIYFGSVCAYYIHPMLKEKDIREISLLLFDTATYRTDNHAYNSNAGTTAKQLHSEASAVCDNEGIKKSDMHLYSKTLNLFRRLYAKSGGYRYEK